MTSSNEIVPSQSRAMTAQPLGQTQGRLAEQGIIRFGIKKIAKNGKEYPSKIDTMRFTSSDRSALEHLAKTVGGKVKAWEKGPRVGEYELLSETTSLRIALPTNMECISQWYELWNKAMCLRRCDGVSFETSRPTPDGAEVTDVPCICNAKGASECDKQTRMTVLIRDAPFGGGWRFNTKSLIAGEQLPEMVNLIKTMQAVQGGIVPALLILKEFSHSKEIWNDRTHKVELVTHKWKVPTIALDGITLDDLIAGRGSLGALASGEQVRDLAIAAAAPPSPLAIEAEANGVPPVELDANTERDIARYGGDSDGLDDDIYDGEIMDTTEGGGTPGDVPLSEGGAPGPGTDSEQSAAGAAGSGKSSLERQRSLLHALVNQCCDDGKKEGQARGCAAGVDTDRFRHAVIRTATGMDQSSNSLMGDEMSRVLDLLDGLVTGKRQFKGIVDGFVRYAETGA